MEKDFTIHSAGSRAIANHSNADPDAIETRAQLARALTTLREDRGLTVRELAQRVGIPSATLGGYLSGRHLPSAAQLTTFIAILRECGIAEDAEVSRWVAALGRARTSSPDRRRVGAEAPYRGLEPFGPADADSFFGRAALTRAVLDRIVRLRTERLRRDSQPGRSEGPALVLVVGASGSGKSSLLNAGVVPAFRREVSDSVLVLTPTTLTAPAALDSAPDLLVIDQYEETFTAADPAVRERCLNLVDGLGPNSVAVLGMRADFYAAALAEPVLAAALQDEQVLVTPMTREELRAAIVEPAQRRGVRVEDALIAAVLADLAPSGMRDRAHDPGALPLMSHALLATWTRATRNRLTVKDYRDAGGIEGAIQQTAEEVYGGLDPENRELSRQLFMRLVNIEDETALTRRRVTRREIGDLADAADIEALVATYVARRLLTADLDSVQITHEALLVAWPRLHDWIDADRDGARIQRRLTDAANAWESGGREGALLLGGTRLSATSAWRDEARHADELNRLETDFLDTSLATDAAARTAVRQQNRRLRQLLALAAVFAVATAVAAGVTLRARQVADRQRAAAAAARDDALSRQVAVESGEVAPDSPDLAAQLAVAAYDVAPTTQARSALLTQTGVDTPTRLLVPSHQPVQAAATSDRTHLLVAAGSDGDVHLWRITATRPTPLPDLRPPGPAGALFAVALSPDGTVLASAGSARAVTLWDVADPDHPQRIATLTDATNTVYTLAFSPDGATVYAGSADGYVHRWHLAGAARPAALAPLGPYGGFVQSVALDGAGDRLAIGTSAGVVRIVPLDGAAAGAGPRLRPTKQPVYTVALSPDGKLLAAAGGDNTLRVWQVPTTGTPTLAHVDKDFSARVNAVAYDRSGAMLAVASTDDGVREYDATGATRLRSLPHAEPVTGACFDAQDRVITTGNDGAVRIWPATSPALRGAQPTVYSLTTTADRHLLAAGVGSGPVGIWRLGARPRELSRSIVATKEDPLDGASAIAPDGRLLAAGTGHGKVYLYDTSDPARPRLLDAMPDATSATASKHTIEGVAFNADATLLASAGDDGTVRVWNMQDPAHIGAPVVLDAPDNYIYSVVFSRDGRYLAAASADRHAYVWRLARGRPRLIATVGGFASYVYAVAFSPRSDRLAVGSDDSTARLYDVGPGAVVRRHGPVLRGAGSTVYAMAFSPDGRTVVGASEDGKAYIWTAADGSLLASLSPGGSGLYAVAFSGAATVTVGGSDDLLHRYSVDPAAAAASLCARAGTPILRSEWGEYVPGRTYDPPCR